MLQRGEQELWGECGCGASPTAEGPHKGPVPPVPLLTPILAQALGDSPVLQFSHQAGGCWWHWWCRRGTGPPVLTLSGDHRTPQPLRRWTHCPGHGDTSTHYAAVGFLGLRCIYFTFFFPHFYGPDFVLTFQCRRGADVPLAKAGWWQGPRQLRLGFAHTIA